MAIVRTTARSLGWLHWPLVLLGQVILLVVALDTFWGLGTPLTPHPVFDALQRALALNSAEPAATAVAGQVQLTATYTPFYMHRWLWLVVAAIPVLAWVISLIRLGRRPQAFQVRTSSGETILIHPGAIANFASARIEDHPAVVRHSITVRQSGARQFAISARVKLAPNHNWVETNREIERSIRDGFSQVMGIEKIDKITLILDQDRKDMMVRPGPAGRAAEAPEPPVRGALEQSERMDDDDADPRA